MTTRTAMAVYARISQDREGTGLGIERQLKECRELAEQLGWTVAEEYVDDNISAFSGKRRPAYDRMLEDIADGHRDAVLAWHMDRLHRESIELELLVKTCERAGVTDLRTVHGSFDLGTGDGMLIARVLAAVANNESESKRRRGRSEMRQMAEAGLPHGGGTRPFGFEDDRITHKPDEAAVIRTLAERALAGETIISLCRWLVAEGVTTVTGKQWRTPTVRQLLLNPRNYGVCVYQGQPFGPAVWDPIITAEQGEALRLLLTNPGRRTNRAARRYLLSGMCRCSLCGNAKFSVPRYETRRYLCRSGHDHGGCGRMAISALPPEQIITEAVLQRLDGPENHDALAGRARDDKAASQLSDEIRADSEQLDELAGLYADRTISATEWVKARTTVEKRRTAARRRLAGMTDTRNIDAYIGQGAALREQWGQLNLDRQRAVVKALVEYVEIMPGTRGRKPVSVERVRPVWRL